MFTLGVVPYLNALPLYRTLESRSDIQITRIVPSQLSRRVAAGECDAGLIPIVDYLRGVGERIISDACIGSNGAVRSVLMFSRVAPSEVRSVAVDTSSHTSVALLRVILADSFGNEPQFVEHAPDLAAMLDNHDAALLIGDRALEAVEVARKAGYKVLDLGEAWKAMTGKPFVFAAWVARRGFDMELSAELSQILTRARNQGRSTLEQIVRNNPIQTLLTPEQVEDYLRNAVDFTLSSAHRDGLEEFERRCKKYNLLDARLVS